MKNLGEEIIKLHWKIIGEDQIILNECSQSIRTSFGVMGIILLLIIIITGFSISYGTYELLESYNIGFFIGIYFSFLILILYLFILYTLTKNVLPHRKVNKIGAISSYVLRVGFLILLGLVVSQPIEYYLFSDEINELLISDINDEIKIRNTKLNKEYVNKLNEIETLNYSNERSIYEFGLLKKEKKQKLENFIAYQNKRNFFIKKMILMDSSIKTWYVWLFSLLFIIFYITPVLIKTSINFGTDYYKTKREIQISIINDHQKLFVKNYNIVLKSKYSEAILEWSTKYENPPFNTIRDKIERLESDKEFSKWLLDEIN